MHDNPVGYPPERRKLLNREELARLEIEVAQEKVRVWVAGAQSFIEDPANQELVIKVFVEAMDRWADTNRKKILERLGLYALGAMFLGLLAVLGWRGWKQ